MTETKPGFFRRPVARAPGPVTRGAVPPHVKAPPTVVPVAEYPKQVMISDKPVVAQTAEHEKELLANPPAAPNQSPSKDPQS